MLQNFVQSGELQMRYYYNSQNFQLYFLQLAILEKLKDT